MVRLALIVMLLVPSTAFAGWAPPSPDARDAYAGVNGSFFFLGAEGGVDGGWRLPVAPLFWVRGRLGSGVMGGDTSDDEWTVALVGLEMRTRHRWIRFAAGLEAGALHNRNINEDGSPDEVDWRYAWSWHAFLELGDRVMGRLGVQGPGLYGFAPAPTVGLAIRF
jgi:hypothetical protein